MANFSHGCPGHAELGLRPEWNARMSPDIRFWKGIGVGRREYACNASALFNCFAQAQQSSGYSIYLWSKRIGKECDTQGTGIGTRCTMTRLMICLVRGAHSVSLDPG